MNKSLLFVITIIIVIIVIVVVISFIKNKEQFRTNKYSIWMYWENKQHTKKPPYLDLCFETIKKHNKSYFNVILLNETTVYNYIPELRTDLDSKLSIQQKTDYIRIKLLYLYGGIWVDSDTIAMNNFKQITEKLNNYDFVGFGCHYKDCTRGGYPHPANWVMASRKHGIFMKEYVKHADIILDRNRSLDNYFGIGRELMWKIIKKLRGTGWDYYHFDSKCIDRDSTYRKIVNKRIESGEGIDKQCRFDLFIPIYNTAPGFSKQFIKMSKKEHMSNDNLFTTLLRLSLTKK